MKLCDSHIHVGQFYERYTSPQELIELTASLGIDKYAVSSTTICEENYSKVLCELECLSSQDTNRACPVLWLTPSMLADEGVLTEFLNSGLKWCCLKIHPELHPYVWSHEDGYFEALLDVAHEYRLPILIHTGGNLYSEARIWKEKIKANPTHTFILAHSRPCSQTIDIMKEARNVYADLSFVDKEDMEILFHSDAASRLLWGSDLPIIEHYLAESPTSYYSNRVEWMKDNLTSRLLELTFEENFKKILKL